MVVLRPVQLADLDQLVDLTKLTGYGLTSLPHDRDLLRRRIRDAQRGFDAMADQAPHGERYLFVLEDLHRGCLVGTSGIVSKVGGFEPFYAYRIQTEWLESETLKLRKEIQTLHLVAEHNGPCEIGSLFLRADYRRGGYGRLLSLARFLFMAEHRPHFDPVVIAELRGVIDEQGRSPFWDAIGRHFFAIDYPQADYLSAVSKKFIAELMPRHPIYVCMLPPEAQAVIGQVCEDTRPARAILESEGFRFHGMVDIFEAGPVLSCPLDEIRTVRASRRAALVDIRESLADCPHCVVATTDVAMRACRAPYEEVSDGIRLTSAAALALNVRIGDTVRYLPPAA